MKFEKLHTTAAIICALLVPIGFIIGTVSESPNNTGRGGYYFFLVGSIYMQFYCLYRIEKGSIHVFSYTHKLERESEPLGFWLFTIFIMVSCVFMAVISLLKICA